MSPEQKLNKSIPSQTGVIKPRRKPAHKLPIPKLHISASNSIPTMEPIIPHSRQAMRIFLQAGADPLYGVKYTTEPYDDRLYVFIDHLENEYDLIFDHHIRSAILAFAKRPVLINYIATVRQQLDMMEKYLVGGAAAILISRPTYDEENERMRDVIEYTVDEELIAQLRRLLAYSAKKHAI